MQEVAAQMAVSFAVSDDGFDGGSSPQFASDLAVDAALLPGTIDPVWLRRIVAHIALVHINALDFPAGQGLEHLFQGVAVIRVPGQHLGVQDELAAFAAFVGGGERDLDAELIGSMRLALTDALGLGGVSGIELPARVGDASGCGFARPWTTARRGPSAVPRHPRSCAGCRGPAGPDGCVRQPELPVVALELLGVGVSHPAKISARLATRT